MRGPGILAAALLNLVIAVACFAELPAPTRQDVTVVSPDSSIPADVAAFSGRWVGQWDAKLDSILIVSKIHPATAKGIYRAEVVYSNGTYHGWYIMQPGSREMDGVIKNGELTIPYGAYVTIKYKLAEDGKSLVGSYVLRGQPYPGSFIKAE